MRKEKSFFIKNKVLTGKAGNNDEGAKDNSAYDIIYNNICMPLYFLR